MSSSSSFLHQVSAFINDDVSWLRGNDVLRRAFNRDVIYSTECDSFVQSCLPAPLAAFLAVRMASEGNLDLANAVVDLLRKCDPTENGLAGMLPNSSERRLQAIWLPLDSGMKRGQDDWLIHGRGRGG